MRHDYGTEGCLAGQRHPTKAGHGWPLRDALPTARGGQRIDWVIIGGESGPGARTMQRAWDEAIQRQCDAAGVPVFRKQLGSQAGPCVRAGHHRQGRRPRAQWPAELRVQRFPEGAPHG